MPKIRWTIILLCFFALAVSYIDRVNLAIETAILSPAALATS